jgi:hypothetical protein
VGSARLYRGLQGQARSASHERNRVRGHALVAQSRSFQLHLSPRCMRARTNHLHHRSNNDLIYVFPAVRVFWCRSRSFVVLLNTPLAYVYAWPCSAPLQPLLPLPFPAPPFLVIFCAHLAFHHSLSCPISYFPPRFPYASLTGLCPIWHIFCLDTGFEHLQLVRLPCWRYRWKRLTLLFPKSPRTLQSDYFPIFLQVQSIQTRGEHVRTTE